MLSASEILNRINSNKFFIGFAMILFNIGSKYLVLDISKSQEQFFKHTIVRRLTLFCIFFVATRDVVTSFLLTAAFVVMVLGLFNDESKFGIVKSKAFYDTKYTKEEYEMSKTIIQEYEKKYPDLRFCESISSSSP